MQAPLEVTDLVACSTHLGAAQVTVGTNGKLLDLEECFLIPPESAGVSNIRPAPQALPTGTRQETSEPFQRV